ncbi:SCO family protein [Halalkalibacter okhensis]|uniref:Transporter n=1 Tax=Halalkalibacter okhensis TaxID=333138 RepID=A0A0B0IEF9_9BACI|nr:SCO family protein [Halalkalibacter okhensis]KHF38424.1 transporter [Halalkalibacter okhensis]
MKKVFSVMILALLLSGCGWVYQVGSGNTSEYDFSEAQAEVVPFEFTNQHGEAYGSEQLEGQYWLANMIFTYCPTVCPTMTPNMQRLQATMQDEGVDMSFISFTVDPERDTAEQLLSYGTNVGADLDSWQFLTGYTQEELANFSAESFKALVQDTDGEDIIHSTSFFLVGPDGQVIRKYDGLQTNQDSIIEDLLETVQN